MRTQILSVGAVALLAGCGVQDKIEQRISEKVAEKVVEVAAGGEVDVETRDGKVSIQHKDGQKIEVDTEKGTTRVVDEQGKVYDYEQGADGATVKGSDGLEAAVGTELPADFPIPLPPAKQVGMGMSVTNPDGSKLFSATYEAVATDLAEVEQALDAALKGKGLAVERSEVTTTNGKLVTLRGKSEDGKIEASAMLSHNPESAHVSVIASWNDRTGVAE